MRTVLEMREDLQRKRQEVASLEAALQHAERACAHRWSDPVRDDVVVPSFWTQDLMGHFTQNEDGTINAPWVHVPEQRTPRWRRTCSTCGKTELTTDVVTRVSQEPRFR